MNARLDNGLLLLGILFALSGMQRARSMLATESREPIKASSVTVDAPVFPSSDSLDDAAATIVANDPFRLSNTPPTVRFLGAVSVAPPNATPRPALVLRAIVGGPPWSALVEGLPGQSGGVVVLAGNTFEKLRIRSIARDTVVVQAPDTTWKLTMTANP